MTRHVILTEKQTTLIHEARKHQGTPREGSLRLDLLASLRGEPLSPAFCAERDEIVRQLES